MDFLVKKYDLDAILFIGSSDWISDDYSKSHSYLSKYDIVKKRYDMIDITDSKFTSCYWLGYPKNHYRYEESIGMED